MLIIPTKKSLPLFTSFPDSQHHKLDDNRSFYSWHANYFNLNRKKILVLVNDLTYSPIVLADINVKNKKYLPDYIKLGIEEVFSFSRVPSVQIKKYFLKAGRMELSSDYNRSLISINNNIIRQLQYSPKNIDFNTILQLKAMKLLAGMPYRSLTPSYSISTELVERELNKLS